MHYLPVFKSDGTVVDLAASKFADGGSTAKTPLTIIGLSQTTSQVDNLNATGISLAPGPGGGEEGEKKLPNLLLVRFQIVSIWYSW